MSEGDEITSSLSDTASPETSMDDRLVSFPTFSKQLYESTTIPIPTDGKPRLRDIRILAPSHVAVDGTAKIEIEILF